MFRLRFQKSQKIGPGYFGFAEQTKTFGHCWFPLANPHSGVSLHFVPESNRLNYLILLCIGSGNTQSFRPFLQLFAYRPKQLKLRKQFKAGF